MTDEWGPWIKHDGAFPDAIEALPDGATFQALFQADSGFAPDEGDMGPLHQCFFWRWRDVRVGWFRTERRRVCDDPIFAPVVYYRVRKPRALIELQRLIANLPEEVDA